MRLDTTLQVAELDLLLYSVIVTLIILVVLVAWLLLKRRKVVVAARMVQCTSGHKYMYGLEGPPCPQDGDPNWQPDP